MPDNIWQAVLSIANRIPSALSGDRLKVDVGGVALSVTQVPPAIQTVAIALTNAGDNTIIAVSSGTKSLRITSLTFTCGSLVTLIFKGGTSAISGAMPLTDFSCDYFYPISLAVGQNFVINTGTAVAVNGYVNYYEV